MRAVLYAIICVLLVLTGSFARAAEPSPMNREFSEAVNLPSQSPQDGTVDFLLELRENSPCGYLAVLTHFPQGLGAEVDKTVVAEAGRLQADAYAETQERSAFAFERGMASLSGVILSGKEVPGRPKQDWGNSFSSVTTYLLSRPSDACLSLLFRTDTSGGGAHGNWRYTALTLNRATGKEVTLDALFPGKEDILSALAPVVLGQLAGKQPDLTADALDLGMHRFVLLPEGLRVVYAPYEIAAYSEGQFMVDVPLAELLRLGADPAFWPEKTR